MSGKLSRTSAKMRRVRAATFQTIHGIDVCVSEDGITDFTRTTYRLFGVPVWRRDTDHVEVPIHVFNRDCLGTYPPHSR